MTIKIRFRYSWIYDSIYKSNPSILQKLKEKNKEYPSIEEILK